MLSTIAFSLGLLLPAPPPPDDGDPPAGQAHATGMEWFRHADRNKDGFITFDEFPNQRFFLRLDKDNDGRLSMEELERAIADQAPPRQGDAGGFRVRRDVPYATHEGVDPRLTSLDLYLPTHAQGDGQDDRGRPLVVYVHGGGWRIGDKARVHEKPAHYCGKGFVLASVNYRLSPEVRHPAHVQDVAEAIAWLRSHAHEFGADPNRVVLMGHSAGAHLVALLATDPQYLRAHGISPSDLAGVIVLDTASFDLERRARALGMRRMIRDAFGRDPKTLRDASPVSHVHEGDQYPPMLVVFSSERPEARTESQRFVGALREAGATVELLEAEGKDHAAVNRDVGVPGDPMSEAVDRFLDRCLRQFGQE